MLCSPVCTLSFSKGPLPPSLLRLGPLKDAIVSIERQEGAQLCSLCSHPHWVKEENSPCTASIR